MTLEELSVIFSADLAPFSAAAHQLSGMLFQMSVQADALAAHFQGAGVQAGEGLRSGLLSRQGAVAAAARQVAQAAAAALRSALQIHSPSRLTYQAGRYFDEGLMQGIESSAGRVEKEAGALGERTAQALHFPQVEWPQAVSSTPDTPSPDMDQLLSRIAITIPLEVDGYRLGMAAIEGINRVSQGTGRVELIL
ncbi:MAG: hypothetical protein E7324_10635 [Clostridiales bacterium]|nr:hypothetical protein [Clostridiales bacterium]